MQTHACVHTVYISFGFECHFMLIYFIYINQIIFFFQMDKLHEKSHGEDVVTIISFTHV